MNNFSNKPTEPTKVDIAASAACTRSGAFALLLTITLSLLLPYWMERKNEVALGRYITCRLNLAIQVETLDENPFWQEYKASNERAESTSIAQLMDVILATSKVEPAVKTQQEHAPPTKRETQQVDASRPRPPAPPIGLSATVRQGLDVIPQIAYWLNQLNDSDLLTRSREVSNFFEFSIVRWANKRTTLMYENVITNNCFAGPLAIANNSAKSERFIPLLDKDALLKCLTLENVRDLAQLELPKFSSPVQLQEGNVKREVEVNPSSLIPRDLYLASVLAQLLLFFVIVHFGAFAREALSSAGFPVQGTLFSAFSRSRGTLFVFLLALWSPFFASVAVAAASRKWSLLPYTVLIGSATLFAYSGLERKSYFGELSPRLTLNRIFELTRARLRLNKR